LGDRLTREERYILEEGARNPTLWAAALFPNHVKEAFASFHREIFQLLFSLATGLRDYPARSMPNEPGSAGGGDAVASVAAVEEPLDYFELGPDIVDNFKGYTEELLREGRVRKLAVAAPRGHAKTTLLMLFVLWCVCYRVKKFVVLISDTEDQAKLQLDAIKAELEGNGLLRRLYGDLVGDLVWGQESIQTSSGIRIQCRGAGQKIRGLKFREQRPDLVIADDILNEEAVEQEERRTKLKRWFFGAVIPAIAKGGGVVVVGTIMHEADLLSELLESGAGWEKRRYAAMDDGGELLWPQSYSVKDLDDIRMDYEEKGELPIFFREYFNKIVSHEASLFKREMFQYMELQEFRDKFYVEVTRSEEELLEADEKDPGERWVLREPLRTYLTVDPSYTVGARTDFSAFVVVSLDSHSRWYVRDVVKQRLGHPEVMKRAFDLVEIYKPELVGMQKVDWNRFFKALFMTEMRVRNKFFQVKELQTYSEKVKGLASKNARIGRLSPYYESRSIYHLKAARGIRDLESELLAFPNSKFDDCSDALSMMVDLVFAPSRKPVERSPYEEDQVDPISGY